MKKGCCGCFFSIILVVVILALAIIARTGTVNIPGFSYLFYELPKPIYQVKLDPAKDYTEIDVEPVVDQKNQKLVFNIQEELLTFGARQALTMGSEAVFAPNTQLAVTPEYLELFGLIQKPFSANVTVRFLPKIQDKNVTFDILSVNIGQLSLPPELATKYLSEHLVALTEKIKNLTFPLEISDIELGEGEIILKTAIPKP
jgi:hypothetical protein